MCPGRADGSRDALAVLEEAGLLRRGGEAVHVVRGADRTGYLDRMLTRPVASVGPGACLYACFLTVRGRILADLLLARRADHDLLAWDARGARAALPVLERWVVADDVRFEDAGDAWARLAVAGPRAAEALGAAGLPAPGPGELGEARLPGGAALVLRRDLGEVPGFELLVEVGGAADLHAGLARRARPVGLEAWDAARVATMTPAFGAELDERTMPNDAALDEVLSPVRRCYPGQEPVVMATHRGHPALRLARVRFAGAEPPAAGLPLLVEGREAGRVTTPARDPRGGGACALAYLRYGLAREDLEVEAGPGGPRGRVEALRGPPRRGEAGAAAG